MSLRQALVLLRDVFEELGGLDEMLWRRLADADWLGSTVKQVLLSQLKQEVSTQSDVKIDVALRCLCLGNV